ncbi:unnamed protein product [Closterium sp. NIES-65]|nr:unnamed protein product [Closterium sp. NIES-65]
MLRPGFAAAGAAGAAWASDPAEWRNATAETAEGAAGGTAVGRGALQDAWTYDVASNERWLSQEKARLLTMVQVGSEGGRGKREWDEEGWEWEQGDGMRKRRWEMKGAWKARSAVDTWQLAMGGERPVALPPRGGHELVQLQIPNLLLSVVFSTLPPPPRPFQIAPRHPNGTPAARADGYWPAYIVRAGQSTAMEVTVEIRAADSDSDSGETAPLSHLKVQPLVERALLRPMSVGREHHQQPMPHTFRILSLPSCAPSFTLLYQPTPSLRTTHTPLLAFRPPGGQAGRALPGVRATWQPAIGAARHPAPRLPPLPAPIRSPRPYLAQVRPRTYSPTPMLLPSPSPIHTPACSTPPQWPSPPARLHLLLFSRPTWRKYVPLWASPLLARAPTPPRPYHLRLYSPSRLLLPSCPPSAPHSLLLHTTPSQSPSSSPHHAGSIAAGISVLAVPTHLLCHLDDPLLVLRHYAAPYLQPGDVVTLGETPLAIMQGGFRHPDSVPPGLVARLACLCFLPKSSLSTACGMQVNGEGVVGVGLCVLVDLVGVVRVILAVIVAVLARVLLGQRGVFYQLAGYQARLIDDITGTLPPYDQFIALGPVGTLSLGPVGTLSLGPVGTLSLGPVGTLSLGPVGTLSLGPVGTLSLGPVGTLSLGPVGTLSLGPVGTLSLGPVGTLSLGPVGTLSLGPVGTLSLGPVGTLSLGPVGTLSLGPVGTLSLGPVGTLSLGPVGTLSLGPVGTLSLGPVGTLSLGPVGTLSLGPVGTLSLGPVGTLSLGPVGTLSLGPVGTLSLGPVGTLSLGPVGTLSLGPVGTLSLGPVGTLSLGPVGTLSLGPVGTLSLGPVGTLSLSCRICAPCMPASSLPLSSVSSPLSTLPVV